VSAQSARAELIEDGVTGYLARDFDELLEKLLLAEELPRSRVRRRAAERFSHSRMAAEHEALYRRVARCYEAIDDSRWAADVGQ